MLVLSPTRELSGQILDSFNVYGRHLRLTSTLAIGGVPMGRQVRTLMPGVEVLVATPGRLLDLVQSNGLKLGHVEFLVLDEADRMLDMGFINDIRKIVAKLPIKRQTLFFSATMPKDIAELADAMLRDPARVAVTPVASTAERIQPAHHPGRLLRQAGIPRPAAEAGTGRPRPGLHPHQARRRQGGEDAREAGIPASAIHGNKSQDHRERTLAAFRTGEIRTLVATDIAARGIDVDGITHVINFDLPNVPETYVHRIGRTARAGAEGIAISLVAGAEELGYLRDIERLIKATVPREDRRTPGQRDAAPAAATKGRPRRGSAAARPSRVRQRSPWRRRQDGGTTGMQQNGRPTGEGTRTARQRPEGRSPSSPFRCYGELCQGRQDPPAAARRRKGLRDSRRCLFAARSGRAKNRKPQRTRRRRSGERDG